MGDTTAAADTTATIDGLAIENAASSAVDCSGSWADGGCVVAPAGLVSVSESDQIVTCGYRNDTVGTGQIVSTWTVNSALVGSNGGSDACPNNLRHGDRVVDNCTAVAECTNTFCAALRGAEVVDETPTNRSWFVGATPRTVFKTGRQLFDRDVSHDWTIPRLNEASVLEDGGAFVIVSPAAPELKSRAVVARYGLRGSFVTNTTSTDPFKWKL